MFAVHQPQKYNKKKIGVISNNTSMHNIGPHSLTHTYALNLQHVLIHNKIKKRKEDNTN